MGLIGKIRDGLKKTRENVSVGLNSAMASLTGENEEAFEELEEALIMADAGVDTALRAVDELRDAVKARGLRGTRQVTEALKEILTGILGEGDTSLLLSSKPSVILLTGVNGVGKTTTAGKLAALFTGEGKSVLLCAADTFRAAAAEQLQVWAKRSGAELVRQSEGADPASVVFDAIAAAKARGTDILICDTAGRLHNKQNLMNELSKINRVIDRELPGADRETLLVLDATTGQNGLNQARQFMDAASLTGIVLTKLDGTAKGGIVFAITGGLKVPVKLIGVGESAADLLPFEPSQFVDALLPFFHEKER